MWGFDGQTGAEYWVCGWRKIVIAGMMASGVIKCCFKILCSWEKISERNNFVSWI